jgi:hypothetical protein
VRFEPGESRPVTLVALGGARHVYGFNALVSGSLDGAMTAVQRAKDHGFLSTDPSTPTS